MTNTPIRSDQVPGGGKVIYHRNTDGSIVEAGADNPLPVNASVTATAQTVGKATAAAPTYVEGDTAAPLSVDLAGNLRTLASVSASLAATANAADPSWTEASSHGLTTDLSGHLRVLCKQQGTWTVGLTASSVIGIDQGTPGLTNAVAVTNLPTILAVNNGPKGNDTIRVVIATDQVQLTNALKVDGSAVTQPVSGTFWQATQPVSLAACPLPTGAATAAKQPALGTAGSASTDVLSIQGIASMVALKVDGSAVTQPVSAASLPLPTGASTETTLAAVNTAIGTKADAKNAATDTTAVSGISIWKQISASIQAAAASLAGTLTVASHAVTNAGTFAVQAAQSGTWTFDRSAVTPVLVDALSTTVKGVLASTAAKLMSYYIYNPNATVAYVQIFDIATTGGVTLGTTVPKWSIAIPPASAANLSGLDLTFALGIQVAATTTAKGLTAMGTALDCNFGYR